MGRDVIATRVADLIERLGRLLRSRSFAEDLNPAQWDALRYLDRCNRFSNNPTALSSFLGSTKGTVSQTVSALERKGLVTKVPRPGQGRSLSIVLTEQGRAALANDPIANVTEAVSGLGADASSLVAGLTSLLWKLQVANGMRTFGKCDTCRHFQVADVDGNPRRCERFDVPISDVEADLICIEHDTH